MKGSTYNAQQWENERIQQMKYLQTISKYGVPETFGDTRRRRRRRAHFVEPMDEDYVLDSRGRMGDDFDYAEAFNALDYKALKQDLTGLQWIMSPDAQMNSNVSRYSSAREKQFSPTGSLQPWRLRPPSKTMSVSSYMPAARSAAVTLPTASSAKRTMLWYVWRLAPTWSVGAMNENLSR